MGATNKSSERTWNLNFSAGKTQGLKLAESTVESIMITDPM